MRSAKARKGLALGGRTLRPIKATSSQPAKKRTGSFVEPERERLIEKRFGAPSRRTAQRRPRPLPRPY